MSGGSLEYSSFKINNIIEQILHYQENASDRESVDSVSDRVRLLLNDLSRIENNLWLLEWYWSGDISVEQVKRDWRLYD
jgi:hypothetical protein